MADAVGDLEALKRHCAALADAVESALPGWTQRCVAAIADAWRSGLSAQLGEEAASAGRLAVEEVVPRLREMLTSDVDAQRTSPLDIVRGAVVFPTMVLRRAGVPPVERDAFVEQMFPEDIYGLSPASFEDVGAGLGELGIVWGAAKAHVIMQRRRSEGMR